VAEWLGSALQKLLQRFESARYLKAVRATAFLFNACSQKKKNSF
jgi:hypothetical protein